MPGLMREARDMQGIRKDVAPKGEPDGAPPASARVAAKEELRAVHGAGFCFERHQRPKRPGVGAGARFQRHAELAPGDR